MSNSIFPTYLKVYSSQFGVISMGGQRIWNSCTGIQFHWKLSTTWWTQCRTGSKHVLKIVVAQQSTELYIARCRFRIMFYFSYIFNVAKVIGVFCLQKYLREQRIFWGVRCQARQICSIPAKGYANRKQRISQSCESQNIQKRQVVVAGLGRPFARF